MEQRKEEKMQRRSGKEEKNAAAHVKDAQLECIAQVFAASSRDAFTCAHRAVWQKSKLLPNMP